jgi:hypothetical protein
MKRAKNSRIRLDIEHAFFQRSNLSGAGFLDVKAFFFSTIREDVFSGLDGGSPLGVGG